MAANASTEAGTKSTTNACAKYTAKSCAKSDTNACTNADAKTRWIYGHLAVRELSGVILSLSLLLPRRHFGGLELRNIQLLKLILKMGHLKNLQ
jgi:hypothetical protein